MLSDMQMAARYAVSSHSKAVFYSGDNGKNHARALAQREAIPLDRTFAGKKLDGIYERNRQRFGALEGDRRSNKAMSLASKRYAQSAQGNVKTFVCGSRPNSVFRKTELPTLLSNNKVTSINGIDRGALAKMHKANPDRAYRAVCLAELRQARRAAKGNEKLLTDVKARQNTYKAHKENQFGKNKSNAQSQGQKVARTTGNSRSPNEAQRKAPATPPPQQTPKRSR
jgi:hypothetical protein